MPSRCVVGGCSNTKKDGVSLHLFPKDQNQRKLWTAKVRLTRANWHVPSESSLVCSAHFDENDFDEGLHSLFNIKRVRKLKPDAVPKIRSRSWKEEKSTKRPSVAEKRERTRMLDSLLAECPQNPQAQVDDSRVPSTDPLDEPGCSTWPDDSGQPEPGPEPSDDCSELVMHWSERSSHSVGTQALVDHVAVATRVKRTQVSIQMHSIGLQVTPESPVMKTTGTMWLLADTKEKNDEKKEEMDEERDEERDDSPESDGPKDPSSPGYQPSSSSSSSDEHIMDTPEKPRKQVRKRKRGQTPRTPWENRHHQPHQEKKFIVFESKLMELMKTCPSCHSASSLFKREVGTLLVVTRECETCSAATKWESQPLYGNLPAGNIQLSASILFGGGSSRETLRILRHLKVAAISERTFYDHQQKILFPAIQHQWQRHQDKFVQELLAEGTPLTIGGDGRADSPGHSAKYGVYTALELNHNKIVDFKLVQSNEVKSSYWMELEGYKRVTQFLTESGLEIRKVVTDRHRQLAKYIRESQPGVIHVYDVWHVSKGIRKKVNALAKQKDCEVVFCWEQSINNHVYWVAASTGEDEPDLRVAKWISLMNHVRDVHEGHSEIFPRCLHGDLAMEGRDKYWLISGTKACEKLDNILTNKLLLNDVKKLSADKQTSSLESYHSLVNRYAPKLKAYSYEGMTCRLQLAAMDFNENSNRSQATTKKGTKVYKVVKPKYKLGKATVKPLKEGKTFRFVDELMDDITSRSADYSDEPPTKTAPPSLTSQHDYPPKEEMIQQHRSRFNMD